MAEDATQDPNPTPDQPPPDDEGEIAVDSKQEFLDEANREAEAVAVHDAPPDAPPAES